MKDKYIKWPDAAERDVIKSRFERRYGYPGVFGCVDGTHVHITAPLQQKQRYVNRHHGYSIIVQGTCDNNKPFRDVFVGQPGSVEDSRTFSRSPLSVNLFAEEFLHEDEHELGDGGYTLSRHR